MTTLDASKRASTHLASGPPVRGDVTAFPSHAELARTLVEHGAVAALASLTRDGHPYASTVAISVDPHGGPIISVSDLAVHTHNLRHDGRASLLVHQPELDGVDPLALARATIVGRFETLVGELGDIRERHLAAHPAARAYVDFPDFTWWRLHVEQVRYVGGFGVMGWVSAESFAQARPDPVIPVAAPMIEHLNDDHADACLLIARMLGDSPDAVSATVTALDRYGITFDVVDASGAVAIARVAFPDPLPGPDAVRSASVDLVRRARAAD